MQFGGAEEKGNVFHIFPFLEFGTRNVFSRYRIYSKYGWRKHLGWTPFVRMKKRYKTRFGCFKSTELSNCLDNTCSVPPDDRAN